MNRHIIIASFLFFLLGALSVSGNAQLVFVDPKVAWTCVDSVCWVDIRVDSLVDSIHSYACLMYIDTSRVYLDSVTQGSILDSIIGDHDTVWFGWEYDDHFPDSLYFGASIFGVGTFVNGPGQLARIWLTGKREGWTPVAFGWCIIRDPYHPSGPGMDLTTEDGQIVVLGPGVRFGDANADSKIDIADAVYLLNYLFTHGPDPIPWWFMGDANCDRVVDIADAVYVVNYLFQNGPEPCKPCG